jgi:putative hydrolase of the HAD superfamily
LGVLKAILFDLDDTIIAWDAVAEQSWQLVCNQFMSRVTGLEGDKLYTTIKEARDWYLSDPERHRYSRLNLKAYRRNAVSIALTRLKVNAPDLANEIADAYGVERDAAAFVYPGAIDTLKYFRNQKVRLALVTNGTSEGQRKKIERYDLYHFFDSIMIEGEMGVGKPDERFFLATLNSLDVSVSEAWMIGDDIERDIGGAQKIGI